MENANAHGVGGVATTAATTTTMTTSSSAAVVVMMISVTTTKINNRKTKYFKFERMIKKINCLWKRERV